MTIFKIESDNVGYNGFTKRDIGKYCIMVAGCPQIFKTLEKAQQCLKALNNG